MHEYVLVNASAAEMHPGRVRIKWYLRYLSSGTLKNTSVYSVKQPPCCIYCIFDRISRISGHPGIRIFGFPDIRFSEFPEIRKFDACLRASSEALIASGHMFLCPVDADIRLCSRVPPQRLGQVPDCENSDFVCFVDAAQQMTIGDECSH